MKTLEENFNRQELLEITKDLIRIESTTTCEARERNVAKYLLDLFEKEGIDCYLQDIEDGRGNVIAVLPGDKSKKSLMLNGHMDTVPVFGMDSPFEAREEDGCLWGRGTADMKSGVAAMAYSLLLLKRMDVELGGDVIFAGVIDEEAAKSTGSRHIAEYGPITDYAIVGEPTELYPVVAHKGIDYFEIRFKGKEAHSSQPWNGVNAVYAAADYAELIKRELAESYKGLVHPLVGAPTVNLGLISGSAKANESFLKGTAETFAGIVPDQCTLWLDIRWTPYQTVEGIIKELEELAVRVMKDNLGMEIEVIYIKLPRPAMEIGSADDLTVAAQRCIEEIMPEKAKLTGVSYFADSGILYGIGGISSMILGPGSISVAHSVEENIEIEQIYEAAKIYTRIAIDICGKQGKEG